MNTRMLWTRPERESVSSYVRKLVEDDASAMPLDVVRSAMKLALKPERIRTIETAADIPSWLRSLFASRPPGDPVLVELAAMRTQLVELSAELAEVKAALLALTGTDRPLPSVCLVGFLEQKKRMLILEECEGEFDVSFSSPGAAAQCQTKYVIGCAYNRGAWWSDLVRRYPQNRIVWAGDNVEQIITAIRDNCGI